MMWNKKDRRIFVPEVIQTSNMDCGPAALKCLLEGFSVQVSYGRLRDACQTDVDGTSIDTLEDIAIELGLEAEQLIVPPDHLLLENPSCLPAIVVVQLSNGSTHFVVCWRRHRNWVQIMDPAVGRRWVRVQDFISNVYHHTIAVPKEDWREWAGTESFMLPLRSKIQTLGANHPFAINLLREFSLNPQWKDLAFIDAATRMMESLILSGGVRAGDRAIAMLVSLCDQYKQDPNAASDLIPDHFWTVSTYSNSNSGSTLHKPDEYVNVTGAVILRVEGTKSSEERTTPHSEILRLALFESPRKPHALLFKLAKESGRYIPLVLIMVLAVSALGVLMEGLLFFTLINVHGELNQGTQRLAFLSMVLALTTLLLTFQFPAARLVMRLGRQLELRIRLLLLKKLPRIGDQYFSSRLQSDMAERSHMLYMIRNLPKAVDQFVVGAMGLLATTVGLIWLLPVLAPWLLVFVLLIVLIPFLVQPVVSELDLRVRSHIGALSNFYLDSLIGIVPIRAHSAESAIQNGHESRLSNWAQSENHFLRLQVLIQALQLTIGAALIWKLVDVSIGSIGQDPVILLIIYWLLSLPIYGTALAGALLQYPAFQNITLRILDPLYAPESHVEDTSESANPLNVEVRVTSFESSISKPVSINLQNISAKAGGHPILRNINLNIQPGEHIAIVGESGSGKTSLVGLLLGWFAPEEGKVLINGRNLDNQLQSLLRNEIAWVDPSIQIWNDSLGSNLSYGSRGEISMSRLISQADLLTVLSSLKDGLGTKLGESGALVSGGEGQRVRIGRALARPDAGLIILDEPFRGLDRTQRRQFQERLRATWKHSTLLFITHDISDTRNFPRVLVMSNGQCVEDGTPACLLKDPQSMYQKFYHDDQHLQIDCWRSDQWSKWKMSKGRLTDLNVGKKRESE